MLENAIAPVNESTYAVAQTIIRDAVDYTNKCGIYSDVGQSFILIVSPDQKNTNEVLTPQQLLFEDNTLSIRNSELNESGAVIWGEWRRVDEIEDKSISIDKLVPEVQQMLEGFHLHMADKSNPHAVTKSQVGLSNVDDTSDVDKPISTAVQAELDKRPEANIKKNPADTAGDSIDTNFTVGTRNNTKGYGKNSTTIGESQAASGENSFIGGGSGNLIQESGANAAIVGGDGNKANGKRAAVVGGWGNNASGNGSFVGGGYSNQAMDTYSVVLGGNSHINSGTFCMIGGGHVNQVSGGSSAIMGGYQNTISAMEAFIGGGESNTIKRGGAASFIAGGYGNETDGSGCFIGGGIDNHSNGADSFVAGGNGNAIIGDNAFTGAGEGLCANSYNAVFGYYNKVPTANKGGDAIVVGNGVNDASRSNAFRVGYDGAVYGLSAFHSTGADYAEYFEWLDGNGDREDRVGFFVALDGEKIRKATAEDTDILGVISAAPSVVGDAQEDVWKGMHLTDKWGRAEYEYVENPVKDADGGVRRDYVLKVNPEYQRDREYIPRSKRPEWDAVGMMGKLMVRDDGTCQVNGYCTSNDDGIATTSSTNKGYRVLKRIDSETICVLIK